MNVVRHDHECVYPNVWEMIRNARPAFARDFTKSTHYQFASPHTTKQVRRRADVTRYTPGLP